MNIPSISMISLKTSLATVAALALLFGITPALNASQNASSIEVAGKSFDTTKNSGSQHLQVHGKGLFKYWSIVKVVAGALYLPEDTRARHALLDVHKTLELAYFVPIKAKDFRKATHEGIKRNVDSDTYTRVKSQIEQLNRLYKNVKSGDRYTLTYTPGIGTTLALNGKALGTVKGSDFAAALFSIWLGEKDPMDRGFRADLLNL